MFSITTVELFLKIALSRNSQGERDDVWSHCVSTTYQLIRDGWRSRSFVMKEKYDSLFEKARARCQENTFKFTAEY